VRLDPVDGLAPLTAELTINHRDTTKPFQRIEIDTDDDGRPEMTLTSLVANEARVDLTFTTPGIHTVRVTVFDPDGKVIYVARRRVRAIGPEELGTLILGVYESMVNRLAAEIPPGRCGTFTGDAQPRYQEIFTALGPDLRTIARQLGTFIDGVVTEQWAEITMVRDAPDGKQAFMIYLIRGGDGIWRMESM
jgi:hypothetical protein